MGQVEEGIHTTAKSSHEKTGSLSDRCQGRNKFGCGLFKKHMLLFLPNSRFIAALQKMYL
jgi:hypothetical protein